MQKTTFMLRFSTILFVSLFFAGCTKQPIKSDTLKPDKQTLLTKLSDFNQARAKAHDVQAGAKCSGFWSCLTYATKVAGADIGGAVVGIVGVKEAAGALGIATGGTGAAAVMVTAGVVVGASASIQAAYTVGGTNPKVKQYGDLVIDPLQFTYLADIGIDHNTVIHDNFYHAAPLDEYYSNKGLTAIEKRAVTSSTLQDITTKVNTASQNYALSNFDFRKYSQTLLNNNLINPDIKDVLDLFMDAYTVVDTKEDLGNVVNYYIAEVANSGLDDDSKEALVGGLIVASQSPFYFLNNF